jgi:Skp family chaperone for outer membrane proteins
VAAGMMILSLTIFVSQRLWAQTTPARPTAPAATSKVALINLSYVVKGYDRFKAFNEELKASVKPFQDKDNEYQKQMEALAKEAQDPKTTTERRDNLENQGKDLKRKMEDNKAAFQKTVGKKQQDQVKILYLDIYNVVSRYAQAHGYDVVLTFHDAPPTNDYWNPANIAHKMQIEALMPMWYNSNLDISNHIVATLNASYKTSAGTKR